MTNIIFTGNHLDCLSAWAGFEINLKEKFNVLVESDVDFIELLLLFEKYFQLDLLETDKDRQDFSTIEEFVKWALEHPAQEPIHYVERGSIPFAKHLRQRNYICQQVGA
ncbi:hypothetical protein RM549_14185 [Salegentibacter sp. F188]|uniref:Uncharacterized protein n=1 Tax=Autumnicola patrickiae TaxID=3075591 RepID=A0ABU3E6T7_9FLAO|nr:hypothetical protein [Salegentibacter sp. F188]MDT0690942.1 hypothetical protein [Salegentibacter sp. F188]